MKRLIFILIGYFIGCSPGAPRVSAQVNGDLFWKNRVQYSDDFDSKWIYDTEHFTVYWYGKSRASALKAISFSEIDFESIRRILEHRISRPIEILAFADIADLKQSNLGNEEAFTKTLPITKVYGNKILVHYDGDSRGLRRQIREGIAQVILRSMLYGDFLKEVFQKTYLKRMPLWFENGLASYCGERWSPRIETALHSSYKNGYLDEPFERWAQEEPVLAGHALWYFIGKEYGENRISDFLYLIRINKEIYQSAFFAFGDEWEDLIAKMTKYYKDHFGKIDPLFEDLSDGAASPFINIKHHPPLTAIDLNPYTSQWTLATNDRGKRGVFLGDSTGRSLHLKRLFRSGSRNFLQPPDLEYPKVAWSPDGSWVALINEKRDVLYLKRYHSDGTLLDEQELRPEIRRVYDMDITREGLLLLTVDLHGFSDLILYHPNTRNISLLLQDFWDDPDVCYYDDGRREGAIISSNRKGDVSLTTKLRTDTILPGGPMDLYFITWNKEYQATQLRRLTHTPHIDEGAPQQIGTDKIAFRSDRYGRYNIHTATIGWAADSLDEQLTGLFFPSAETYYWDTVTKALVLDVPVKAGHFILKKKPSYPSLSAFTPLMKKDARPVATVDDTLKSEEPRRYDPLHFFESRFALPPSIHSIIPKSSEATSTDLLHWITGEEQRTATRPQPFKSSLAYAYFKQFRLYDLSTKLDNSPLFDGLIAYENVAGNDLSNSPIRAPSGVLMKMHLKELFEDYSLIAGMRVTSGLNSWEEYVQWIDRKHLIDKTWTFYRHARRHTRQTPSLDPIFSKDVALVGQYQLKYPFDVYRSVRASATFRQERSFDLISDRQTALSPSLDRQRIGIKMEYVMDNTMTMDLNLLRGTRYNIGIEWLKRFTIDLSPWTFKLGDTWMMVGGWDFRHYIPVLRHSVLAFRWAGALSFGPEKILYLLGGTSDELNYSIHPGYPVPPDIAFGYKTVAPPLRGFSYNARNGSAYSIANAEWRIPVTKYLMHRPSKWSFVRHLQLVPFADAGLGWYGWNPLDPDSNQNVRDFENPAVKLRVKFYTEPLLIGYGLGLRTSVLGYFFRIDYGWGNTNGVTQKPKLHLSMGLDF